MRDVALAGPGNSELFPGPRVLLQQEHAGSRCRRMDRAEKAGWAGTNNGGIVLIHGTPARTISLFKQMNLAAYARVQL